MIIFIFNRLQEILVLKQIIDSIKFPSHIENGV